jgi:hypothetical protein
VTKRLPRVNECLNCDIALTTAFCPHCGQEAVQHTASVSEIAAELAGNLFNLDSKLFRTLGALLFKPGLLTVAYNRGKRVRYLAPLRLYLTCSIAFFLLLAWKQSQVLMPNTLRPTVTMPRQTESETTPDTPNPPNTAARKIAVGKKKSGGGDGKTRAKRRFIDGDGLHVASLESIPDSVDEFKKLLRPGQKVSPISLYVIGQMIKIKHVGAAGIVTRFLGNLPNMMFFLLPLFAITLKLLYIRSRALYVEHLVFVLHTHAFLYTVLAALLLMPHNGLKAWAPAIIPVYIFLAMRRVYSQPWWKTGVKFGMLAVGYFVILILSLIGTFVVTFLTI